MTLPPLHQGQPRLMKGATLAKARVAVILVHGRGGDADDMMSFGEIIADADTSLVALQAANKTWYPERFMEPLESNEPWLSSALNAVGDAVAMVAGAGIPADRVVLLGFSQGACLSLEFAARNARRYGAVIALAGGLIGPDNAPRDYASRFEGTPVFLGCGDRDPHIPIVRVQFTREIFETLGAHVDTRVYGGLSHVIIDDEVSAARTLVANVANSL